MDKKPKTNVFLDAALNAVDKSLQKRKQSSSSRQKNIKKKVERMQAEQQQRLFEKNLHQFDFLDIEDDKNA